MLIFYKLQLITKSKLLLLQRNNRNTTVMEAVGIKTISVKISNSKGKGVKQTIFHETYFRNITVGNYSEVLGLHGKVLVAEGLQEWRLSEDTRSFRHVGQNKC